MKKILYFSAEWCGPCRTVGPIIYNSGFNYEKIDVDKEFEITKNYNIKSIPTLILVENNQEKKRHIGIIDIQGLNNFWN